jgi:hypothetical protein
VQTDLFVLVVGSSRRGFHIDNHGVLDVDEIIEPVRGTIASKLSLTARTENDRGQAGLKQEELDTGRGSCPIDSEISPAVG